MTKKNDNLIKVPIEATNYYLYSFQIHNKDDKLIDMSAKIEKNKLIFEFEVDDKMQKHIMKEFKKLGATL